ncbi:MAG: fibronectin type III domain-containing protein, partial [bacterium]|nr:fibronectin type III domain-containing protein [bacterium]
PEVTVSPEVTAAPQATPSPVVTTPPAATSAPTVKPATPAPMVTVGQVKNLKLKENKTNAITISWSSVSNASGYEVTYTKNNRMYSKKVTGTSYTLNGLSAGTTYSFTVKAYRMSNKNYIYGKSSSNLITTTKPAATKVTASKTDTDSTVLSYKKVTGADIYRIQQYKNKKWVTIASTSSTKVTVEKLAQGTTYQFRVQAYRVVDRKVVYGQYSNVVKVTTQVKKVSPSVKAGTKKATVSWKKASGVTGYELYVSANKSKGFKKKATIKANQTKITVSNLQVKKTYYFKMRAYKVVGGKKVYSSYSKVVSTKIK